MCPTENWENLFGSNTRANVIEFFLRNPNEEYTLNEVARGANVGRTTLWESGVIQSLLNAGLIIKSREIGMAKLFKFNTESQRGKIWLKLYNTFKHRYES